MVGEYKGVRYPSGYLYFFDAEDNLLDTFMDRDMEKPNTNPVVLNHKAEAETEVWLKNDIDYYIRLVSSDYLERNRKRTSAKNSKGRIIYHKKIERNYETT